MNSRRFLFAASAFLALSGCKASFGNEEDEGWRPFRADSPVFSPGGTLDWQALPSNYGSRLTVPRVIGPASSTTRLPEEDGNIWPAPEPPRTAQDHPDRSRRGGAGHSQLPAARPSAPIRVSIRPELTNWPFYTHKRTDVERGRQTLQPDQSDALLWWCLEPGRGLTGNT